MCYLDMQCNYESNGLTFYLHFFGLLEVLHDCDIGTDAWLFFHFGIIENEHSRVCAEFFLSFGRTLSLGMHFWNQSGEIGKSYVAMMHRFKLCITLRCLCFKPSSEKFLFYIFSQSKSSVFFICFSSVYVQYIYFCASQTSTHYELGLKSD